MEPLNQFQPEMPTQQVPSKKHAVLVWTGGVIVVVVLIWVWLSWRVGTPFLFSNIIPTSDEQRMLELLTPSPDSELKMTDEEVQAAIQATTPPKNSELRMTDEEVQAALEATTPPTRQ